MIKNEENLDSVGFLMFTVSLLTFTEEQGILIIRPYCKFFVLISPDSASAERFQH